MATVVSFPNLYVNVRLTFSANSAIARGGILSVVPDLDTNTASGRPLRSFTCTVPHQALTLMLQTNADVAKAQARAAQSARQTYVFDRKGRIIGSRSTDAPVRTGTRAGVQPSRVPRLTNRDFHKSC